MRLEDYWRVGLALGFWPAVAALGQAPSVAPNGVLHGALAPELGLCPGVIASVFGSNLSNGTCTSNSLPLPTTLCDSRVTVNGTLAPLLLASPQQLTLQLPVDLQPGMAQLVVERQGVRSAPVSIRIDTHAPGIVSDAIFAASGRQVTCENPVGPGDTVVVYAFGLGPTNPVVPAGSVTPGSTIPLTITSPTASVGGQPADVLVSALTPGTVGTYQVNLRLPQNLSNGRHPTFIEIGGRRSNTVELAVAAPRSPLLCAVVNGASFAREAVAAPGTMLSVFGSGFGSRDNLNAFPSSEFEGLSLSIDEIPAPLFHVIASRNQLNILAPAELPESGEVTIQARTAAGASRLRLQMATAAPGIFRLTDPSNTRRSNAAVQFAGTAWLAVPQSMARALGIPDSCVAGQTAPAAFCGQPARPGDILQVYVTGLGKATPGGDPAGRPLPTGSAAPADGNPLYQTVLAPEVTIGGARAQVRFSGLAPGFAGLYQINVAVPDTAPEGDDVVMRVSTPNGRADTATIAVRR